MDTIEVMRTFVLEMDLMGISTCHQDGGNITCMIYSQKLISFFFLVGIFPPFAC